MTSLAAHFRGVPWLGSIDWSRVSRLVFVCKGNVCRSVYAEYRMRLLGHSAVSCGLETHGGVPANGDARRVAAERGLLLEGHLARPLGRLPAGLSKEDLVVAMEPWHADRLVAHCRAVGAQLTLAGVWASEPRLQIRDPYGNTDDVFRNVFDQLDSAVSAISDRIKAEKLHPDISVGGPLWTQVSLGGWAASMASRLPVAKQALARGLGARATVFLLHRARSMELSGVGHTLVQVERAVQALRRLGADFVPIQALIGPHRGQSCYDRPRVAFTIDDGYLDQGLLAERLLALGIRPALFVITDLASGRDWPWDSKVAFVVQQARGSAALLDWAGEQYSLPLFTADHRRQSIRLVRDLGKLLSAGDLPYLLLALQTACRVELPSTVPECYRALNWEALKRLSRLGVDIAPHGRSHRVMTSLSDEEARAEIEGSWREVSRNIPAALPVLAWPTGRARDFGPRDMAFAMQAGLHAAFAVGGGYCDIGADAQSQFALQRFGMPENPLVALRYASGMERLVQRLRN